MSPPFHNFLIKYPFLAELPFSLKATLNVYGPLCKMLPTSLPPYDILGTNAMSKANSKPVDIGGRGHCKHISAGGQGGTITHK